MSAVRAEVSMLDRVAQWAVQVFLGISLVFNMAGSDAMQPRIAVETAKVVFSRDGQGALQALVIPHTETGHFPRSGWILCRIEDSALRDEYERRLADKQRLEGYFRVRYRVTGEDGSLPILRYLGVIEDISPWKPDFPSKAR